MQSYINILYATLLGATIIGFVRKPFMDLRFQKLLPYFLLLICVLQVIAIEYSRPLPRKSNHWIFNIYNPIECLFYAMLLFESLNARKLRKAGIFLMAIYGIFFLYNILFLQGFWLFNNYTYVLGAFIIVCIALFLFIEMITSENQQPLLRRPIFWIASGLILGMLGNFIILGLMQVSSGNSTSFINFSRNVLRYSNTVMYLLFIVAFLCKQSKRKDLYS